LVNVAIYIHLRYKGREEGASHFSLRDYCGLGPVWDTSSEILTASLKSIAVLAIMIIVAVFFGAGTIRSVLAIVVGGVAAGIAMLFFYVLMSGIVQFAKVKGGR
jgi:hypothetical protein